MRKLVVLFSTFGSMHLAIGQPKISNFSFENWESRFGKTAPTAWYCDSLSLANGSIRRSNGGTEGTYSVQLTTVVDKTNIVSSYIQRDDSLISTPGNLLFDYKVINNNSLFNGLYIEIYFKDSKKKALKDFQWSSSGNSTTFVEGVMPISFNPGEIPKYYTLRISYFYTTALAGEYTLFDNFRFAKANGLSRFSERSNEVIYPNPASTIINFNSQPQDQLSAVRFIGIDGKISVFPISNSTLDISMMPQGIYTLELVNVNTEVIKRQKISIMR